MQSRIEHAGRDYEAGPRLPISLPTVGSSVHSQTGAATSLPSATGLSRYPATMQTSLRKMGNSTGLIIPRTMLGELG